MELEAVAATPRSSVIRDLKTASGSTICPQAARRERGVAREAIAHNLARWTVVGWGRRESSRTCRSPASSPTAHALARRWTVHLPKRWPWFGQLAAALARLRAPTAPGLTPRHSADPGPSLAPACSRPRAPSRSRPQCPRATRSSLRAPPGERATHPPDSRHPAPSCFDRWIPYDAQSLRPHTPLPTLHGSPHDESRTARGMT